LFSSEDLSGLDSQRAVQVYGDIRDKPVTQEFTEDIEDLLGPFHGKGRYYDFFTG